MDRVENKDILWYYGQNFDQTNTFITRAENQFISKNMGSRLKNPESRPTRHVES